VLLRIAREACPHCSRTEIYVSRSQTIWEDITILLLLRPVRCRSCLARFYRPLWIATPVNPTQLEVAKAITRERKLSHSVTREP
jgi:hypothetical protein